MRCRTRRLRGRPRPRSEPGRAARQPDITHPLGDTSRAAITRDPPGSCTDNGAHSPGPWKRGVRIRSRSACRPLIGMMRTPRHLRFDGTRPQSSRCVTHKQPPEVERRVLCRCFCVTVRPLAEAPCAPRAAAGSSPPRVPRRLARKPGAREKGRHRAPTGVPYAARPPVGRRSAPMFDGLAGLLLIWGDDSASGHSGAGGRNADDTRGAPSRPTADTPRPPRASRHRHVTLR